MTTNPMLFGPLPSVYDTCCQRQRMFLSFCNCVQIGTELLQSGRGVYVLRLLRKL